MMKNDYIPFPSKILEVIRHTEIEYTFRMEFQGEVKPGQFFEVSIPKYGEVPISVSGIGENFVDLTIRRVGKVTGEVFERYVGDTLLLRGPYGNGFDVSDYMGKDIIVMAAVRPERKRGSVWFRLFSTASIICATKRSSRSLVSR